MSYYVICPSCNEKNIGSAFYCAKCQTHLVGIPRQEDSSSEKVIISLQKTVEGDQITSNEDVQVESISSAIWRFSRVSLTIYLLALLLAIFICVSFNHFTITGFSNTLFYIGGFLAFSAYFVFRGSVGFFRSQLNPLNPMNKAMLSTFSARTSQFWRDYTQGISASSTIATSAVLCILSSLLVALTMS